MNGFIKEGKLKIGLKGMQTLGLTQIKRNKDTTLLMGIDAMNLKEMRDFM